MPRGGIMSFITHFFTLSEESRFLSMHPLWIYTGVQTTHTCMTTHFFSTSVSKTRHIWTSLVIQWLRICLSMQGTWVRSLVQEDSSWLQEINHCASTTEPVHAPQLLKLPHPRALALQQGKSLQWKAHTPQVASSPHLCNQRKAHTKQRRPSTAKNE